MKISTSKAPIRPTIRAIESMQRNIDYWGARAERAEDERDRLRELLQEALEMKNRMPVDWVNKTIAVLRMRRAA